MKRVAVLGTGGFGTAIAHLAVKAGLHTTLWGRDPAHVGEIVKTRKNLRALPKAHVDEAIMVTSDARLAVAGADCVFIVIPAQFLRSTLQVFQHHVSPGVPLISGVKGLEVGTLKKPTEVFCEVLGPHPTGVLSGPSHAEEILDGLPVSLTMAGTDRNFTEKVRDAFASPMLRIYISTDPLGVELAGALKNVMAIAAGVCDGLALGDNAKAALVTRALAEMTRYGAARGAERNTFSGLAGIGDLITTCYSRHGRNRSVGERRAAGESLDQILKSMTQVAEGVATARALHDDYAANGPLDKFASDLPICSEVYSILYENKHPRKSVGDLMTRPPREEP